MLVSDVPYPEEQGGHQSDDHGDHGAFQIDGVADVNTTFVGFIRCEKERLEGAECRTELRELSTLLKFGLHVIQKIS